MTTSVDSIDPLVLRQIQVITTLGLAELHRVCERIGVRYTVYGGTAIGAVRHQGFIPWDDDADVCMPRADYERFLMQAPGELGADFCLLEPHSTPGYPQTFAVLGIKGTQFISQAARKREFKMPIGVDIFPLDTVPAQARAYRSQARATWFWGRLLFLRATPSPDLPLPTPIRQVARTVAFMTHWGLRALGLSPAVLQRRWERAARRHEKAQTGLLGDYSTRDPKRWSAREDELFPAQAAAFENIEVWLAQANDTILRRGYGDYLELPPPGERVGHKPAHIDFGPHQPKGLTQP